jgi:hypothetical protein
VSRVTCSCGGGCIDRSPSESRFLAGQVAAGAKGFREVVGREVRGFCCPLCTRELDEGCASVAHAPSEAIGGRPRTFLCRRCNSFLGTAFEASAIDAVRRSSDPGSQEWTVRFGRKGGPMIVSRAVFETGDDGNPRVTLDPIGDLSPYVLEDFERHRHGPMMLQVRGESDLPTKLAFLSWAFLALFARFGYTYALARCSRLVRKALIY